MMNMMPPLMCIHASFSWTLAVIIISFTWYMYSRRTVITPDPCSPTVVEENASAICRKKEKVRTNPWSHAIYITTTFVLAHSHLFFPPGSRSVQAPPSSLEDLSEIDSTIPSFVVFLVFLVSFSPYPFLLPHNDPYPKKNISSTLSITYFTLWDALVLLYIFHGAIRLHYWDHGAVYSN